MARKFLNGVQSYFNDSNYTLLGYDSLDVVGGDLVLKRAGAEKLRIGANTATFKSSVSIQSDNDNRFLVRSNDYTISRIISRGNTGTNLDKGLFSLMSSDGTNNNVEKVRIDTAGNSWFQGGNIGIGMTSPAYKLDITGDSTSGVIAVRNSDNGRDTFRSENAAGVRTVNIGNDGNAHGIILVRGAGGTTTNYIAGNGSSYFNAGNVAIGGTSPNSKLDVRRAGNGIALELHQTSGSADDYVDLKMIAGNTNAGTLGTILRHKRDGTGGGDFSILTNGTLTGTPATAVTFNSNQTTNFHNTVYFSSANVGLISWGSMGGGTGFGIRGESGRALSLGSNGAWDKLIIDTSGDATFAGDVTIGALTSGETAQLTVNNEGGVPSVARFKSRTNKAHIEISDNDTTGYISSENGLFSIGRNAGVNAAHININASNQVLIGASTTSFNDKLYVHGDGYTTGAWRVGTPATYVGKMFNSSGVLTIQSDGDRDIQIGSSNNADVIAIDTSEQSTTFAGKITSTKSSTHTAQGSISATNAHLDLYNSLQACLLYTSPSPRDRG